MPAGGLVPGKEITMYKFKLIAPNGETEIIKGDWSNQRDARKFAIISSVIHNTGTPADEIEVELLEPVALTWGGARPNAGRPALADEPTIEGTICLPASLDAKAKRLGDGNRSAGIRKALESLAE